MAFAGVAAFVAALTIKGIKSRRALKKKSIEDNRNGFLLGMTKTSHTPLFLSDEEIAEHMLIVGGGGYGQKELQLSFLYRTMLRGGGALYLNMHGDLGIAGKIAAWSDNAGRSKDLINLAFPSPGAPLPGYKPVCFNPFDVMDAETAAKSIVLGADVKSNAPSKPYLEMSFEMHRSILSCLFWLRDYKGLYVDAQVIQDHLNYEDLLAVAERKDLPEEHLKEVRNYLERMGTLGEDLAKKQHTLLQMMSTERLKLMTEQYPEIFISGRNDVNFFSVIEKQRIVSVTFPSLARSPDHIIFLSSLVLGAFECCARKISRTSEKSGAGSHPPFLVLSTEGGLSRLGNLCREGRANGLAMVLATADPSSLRRISDKEAEAIMSNTSTKIFMHVDEKQGATDATISKNVEVPDLTKLGMQEGIACCAGKHQTSIIVSSPPSAI
ncbi:type IV secretory system conjugative DNA transfer family protein [Acetobacter persici]|uniref:type IV secretion system DNA-binding domain-containing protein n=1 Tax=Acetobacter persici TaxID=1076596 RepID=UPI0012FE0637|nr:type IV secretion system DNA-binding domain-containing protein [Acetobacter persici]